MFSYRHGFHAGNHADILKHITLMLIARYLIKKEKPLFYMDTHAGAGLYNIESSYALQTGEAADGIGRLLSYVDRHTTAAVPPEVLPYITLCQRMIAAEKVYPGSPEIVRSCLRPVDSLVLSELHPSEIGFLKSYAAADKRLHVHFRDGFDMLKIMLPPRAPLPARGFVLVDPGYEDIAEYAYTAAAVSAAAAAWKTGTFAIWYPLIERRHREITVLKETLMSAAAETLCAELYVREPGSVVTEDGHIKNLYGSGIIVIRPTWELERRLQTALAWTANALSPDGSGTGVKYSVSMENSQR